MNDNHETMQADVRPTSDPHGQAALVLVESLIHGLCESSTLSTGQAVAITERAVEVQFDRAEEAADVGTPLWRSHALLSAILASLQVDGDGPPPRTQLA